MESTVQQNIRTYLLQTLTPHFENFHEYRITSTADGIEVHCQVTEDRLTKTKVLMVLINEEYSQIQITNIFMPESMRLQGIGKSLIGNIHLIGNQFGYRTFVTELTSSFFEKLQRRGARIVEKGDTVEIVDETRLL